VSGREVEGLVEAALPSELYRVNLANGTKITASLSSIAKQTTVRVIPGDRVIVEISDRDPTRGKIKSRLS
jgi:translation initiation factor IF-1